MIVLILFAFYHPYMHLDTETFPVEKTYILGVSGGSDSVALLHLFVEHGYSHLIVAHVDHQLRKESKEEAVFVRNLAETYGLPVEVLEVDVKAQSEKQKRGIEEMGREVRYSFFQKLREQYAADFIVTAHHADDQLETILLNIIRGCGMRGLVGMMEQSHYLWRPLLSFSKKQVLRYCREHELEFREDHSNQDLQFKRNFLRKNVIPSLKEMNPKLLTTFERNRKIWKETWNAFQKRADSYLVDYMVDDEMYDLKKFLSLNGMTQLEVLRQLYAAHHGNLLNLQQSHLEQVLKVLTSHVSGKQKEFGPGLAIVKHKNTFEIIQT
jgi:tRNA(Ile)-lysidine synthase